MMIGKERERKRTSMSFVGLETPCEVGDKIMRRRRGGGKISIENELTLQNSTNIVKSLLS